MTTNTQNNDVEPRVIPAFFGPLAPARQVKHNQLRTIGSMLKATAVIVGLSVGAAHAADTVLERPVLVSPQNLATGLPTEVPLQWNKVRGAVRYEWEVYRGDKRNSKAAADRTNRATNAIFNAQPGTRYFFRVRARGDRAGATTEIDGKYANARFTTAAGPAGPTLSEPPDKSLLGSTEKSKSLKWDKVAWANRYEVETWSNGVTNKNNPSSPSYKCPADPKHVTHWHVRAIGNSGVLSPWSDEWTFGNIPQPPVLLLPVNDSTNLPTLKWKGSKLGNSYNVEVYENGDLDTEPVYHANDVAVEYCKIPTPLKPLTTYLWRVEEIGAEFTSDWSPNSFQTTIWPPSWAKVTSSTFLGKGVYKVSFSWEPVYATNYTLYFNGHNHMDGYWENSSTTNTSATINVHKITDKISYYVVATFANGQTKSTKVLQFQP